MKKINSKLHIYLILFVFYAKYTYICVFVFCVIMTLMTDNGWEFPFNIMCLRQVDHTCSSHLNGKM